jgi:hypothetical protein
MLKRRDFILTMIIILICSAGVLAKGKLEISGTLDSSIEGISDDGELIDRERLDLELKKNFGFDADMYIDLATYSMKNEDAEIELNEAYLNYYTDNIDWRIGKQIINWGSSYKLQPTNYFTPCDYTALKPLDEKKGIKAVNGRYYTANGLEITGVVIPNFEGNKLSIEQTKLVKQVEDDIENIQGGVKITKRAFRGFDLSASMYHGFDKRYLRDNKGEYIYPEVNKLGLDIIGDIQTIGVWTELAYGSYDDKEFDSCLEGTIGFDYKFTNDLYLVGQAYYRGKRLENETELRMINFHLDKPVFKFHQIESNFKYEFETDTFIFEPQFNYSLTNSTELQVGGTYVDSNNEQNPIISSLGKDRVYTRLKIEF